MGKIQDKLIKENEEKIKNFLQEIKIAEPEKEELEAKLKVEEKILEELVENSKEEIKKQIQANISVLKDLITVEQSKIDEAVLDIEIIKLRIPILRRITWHF